MSTPEDTGDFRRRVFAALLFNLFPLILVIHGDWRAFDVIAFYWVEVIVAGVIALGQLAISTTRDAHDKKLAASLGNVAALIGFPLHFGFFIVMSCFLVGSFLPPDVAPRKLTSPLVPLEIVLDNIDFWTWAAGIAVWEAAQFAYARITHHARDVVTGSPVGHAYVRLFTMFGGAFFGVLLGMAADSRIWGAVVIVAAKTALAVGIAYGAAQKTRRA